MEWRENDESYSNRVWTDRRTFSLLSVRWVWCLLDIEKKETEFDVQNPYFDLFSPCVLVGSKLYKQIESAYGISELFWRLFYAVGLLYAPICWGRLCVHYRWFTTVP